MRKKDSLTEAAKEYKKAYHQRNTLIKEQTPKNEGSGSIPFSS